MNRRSIALLAALLIACPAIAQEKPLVEKPTADAAPAGEKPAAPAEVPSAPVVPAPDKDANGVYQVFRITDNQLNCEQLIAEMNSLNATIKSQTERQAQAANGGGTGRRIGGAALSGALGGIARGQIARNIPGLGYAGAVAAASATDAASNAVGTAVANGRPAAAAPATASNESQRLNRVSQLFGAKGC